jgi:hypothetical protein
MQNYRYRYRNWCRLIVGIFFLFIKNYAEKSKYGSAPLLLWAVTAKTRTLSKNLC